MKKLFAAVAVVVFTVAQGQFLEDLTYGIKAGGVYSQIDGLPKMVVSEDYYEGFKLKGKPRWGAVAGLFLNYKFPDSWIALQPEITYSMQGGSLKYKDDSCLHYRIDYKYSYISLTALVKVYPTGGLNIGIGPVLSFNLTPSTVEYSSNQKDFGMGSDLTTRQVLRNSFKGKSDFALALNLGYEWENGLMIEARGQIGLADVIETQENQHKFIENRNLSTTIMLTVGYAFNFDSRSSFR